MVRVPQKSTASHATKRQQHIRCWSSFRGNILYMQNKSVQQIVCHIPNVVTSCEGTSWKPHCQGGLWRFLNQTVRNHVCCILYTWVVRNCLHYFPNVSGRNCLQYFPNLTVNKTVSGVFSKPDCDNSIFPTITVRNCVCGIFQTWLSGTVCANFQTGLSGTVSLVFSKHECRELRLWYFPKSDFLELWL